MIVTLLKDIVSIKVGYHARRSIRETVDGSHQIIQGRNFVSHALNTKNLARFTPDRNPKHYAVKKGDILFMARGMENFAYYVKDHLADTMASASFYIIRVKSEALLAPYLAWLMNQGEAQNYFVSCRGAGAISFISKNSLCKLQVKIPSIDIQEKIGKIVQLWKRERILSERLIECRSRLVNGMCVKAIEEK